MSQSINLVRIGLAPINYAYLIDIIDVLSIALCIDHAVCPDDYKRNVKSWNLQQVI